MARTKRISKPYLGKGPRKGPASASGSRPATRPRRAASTTPAHRPATRASALLAQRPASARPAPKKPRGCVGTGIRKARIKKTGFIKRPHQLGYAGKYYRVL
jgi:hypothetical protein